MPGPVTARTLPAAWQAARRYVSALTTPRVEMIRCLLATTPYLTVDPWLAAWLAAVRQRADRPLSASDPTLRQLVAGCKLLHMAPDQFCALPGQCDYTRTVPPASWDGDRFADALLAEVRYASYLRRIAGRLPQELADPHLSHVALAGSLARGRGALPAALAAAFRRSR